MRTYLNRFMHNGVHVCIDYRCAPDKLELSSLTKAVLIVVTVVTVGRKVYTYICKVSVNESL